MTAERWQQIEDILDEVMALAEAERAARIEQLCAGDTALYSQVEEMVGYCAQAQAESFLESPPHLEAQDLLRDALLEEPPSPHLEAGTRVGSYAVVGVLGHGGMGEVYLAERANPHMRVALKIVKRGMDTREILQRFRYEREILARLQHQHIAQLYDGGVTDDGRPYFAMEYVEGKPLDAYCDDNAFSIRKRLELFATVCEAVRYAHRNFVVHRDLKPGNILVREDEAGRPQVKLLDFGIAKLLEEDAPLYTVPMTEAGARRMTPGYAAPEQVTGGPTTASTDVYALGVILYQLLTGRRPYAFKDRSVTEIERVILGEMPGRPSTVVLRAAPGDDADHTPEALSRQRATSPSMLRRQLAGDLDAIALKALRKEPGRRYASAGEFVDDIRRYLDNRPVLAQPDAVAYRVTKFVQRHTAGVAAAAAMVTLITALVTGFTLSLANERDRAEQAAARAIATRDFMVGTFALADPEATPDPQAALDSVFAKRDLIEANLMRVDELPDPLDRAVIMEGMARAYVSYGAFEKADSLYRLVLAIKHAELSPEHAEIAVTLHGLALALINQGEHEQADSLLRQALAIRLNTWGETHPAILSNLNDLGYAHLWRNDWQEAEKWYRDALEMTRRLETRSPADESVQLKKAESLDGLARALLEQTGSGLSDHSYLVDSLYHQALDIRRALLGEDHPKTASTLFNMAYSLRRRGDLEGALAYLNSALEIYRRAYRDEHVAVANSLYERGRIYHALEDHEKARDAFLEAINIHKKIVDPNHRWRILPLIWLGQLLAEHGDAAGAVSWLREGLAVCAANALSDGDSMVLRGRLALSRSLIDLTQFEEAEALLQTNYRAVMAKPNKQDWLPGALQGFVTLYEAWQKPDEAAAYRTLLGQAGASR